MPNLLLKRRLLPKLKPSKPQQIHLPVQYGDKFDEASGQVYRETYIAIPNGSDQDWARNRHQVREKDEESHIGYPGVPATKLPSTRASKGVQSLYDIAMVTILDNMADLDFEILQALPTSVVDRIWNEAESTQMSLNVWKTFSKLFQSRDETTLRTYSYRETIESPSSPMEIYTCHLTSNSFDFLTILSITTSFNLRDLVKLSEIPNLGVLEIIRTSGTIQCAVHDRLIRAWSIAAINDGAFKVLRILRLWNHPDITAKSLAYANNFPALGVYDLRGCAINIRSSVAARCLGWTPSACRDFLNVLHAACVKRTVLLREKLGLEPQPVRRVAPEQLWDGARVWKLPRKDISTFLTRDETSRPGTPRNLMEKQMMNEYINRQQITNPNQQSIYEECRWWALDDVQFAKSQKSMTWDFELFSAYARLGELRGDVDFKRSGIHIGDQAMVGKELINSLPMASIRLGPTSPELRPTDVGRGWHQPLYSSMQGTGSSSLLRQLHDKGESDPIYDPRNICFIRVKVPSNTETFAIPTLDLDKENRAIGQDPPRKRKSILSIASHKKMKLGDALGSFL